MKKILHLLILSGFYFGSLIVVGLITWYFTRNLTGAGPIPERTSFARRLPGVPDGDHRRYSFFYMTTRATDADNNPFESDGRRRSDAITAGKFDIRINPSLRIEPWVWNDEAEMKIVDRTQMSEDDALVKIREAVAASPHKSLLIVIWGFRDRFQTAAVKTAYTAYVLDINTPVLLFDWPGNQGEGPGGYLASREIAHKTGPQLGQALTRVARETGAERIWIMGSSLGAQTIADAFGWMNENAPDLTDDKPEFDHVVLSAPDVAEHEFNDRFALEIKAFARHLTAYVASNDQALLMGKIINRSRRLGRPDITRPTTAPSDDPQLQSALDLLELQGKGAKNLDVIDATPINRTRNLHHFFTDSPEFFDDLHRHLLKPDDAVSRRLYPVRTENGSTFWILWDY